MYTEYCNGILAGKDVSNREEKEKEIIIIKIKKRKTENIFVSVHCRLRMWQRSRVMSLTHNILSANK
jgi:hypothetical protein